MKYDCKELRLIGMQSGEVAANNFKTISAIVRESVKEDSTIMEKLYDCGIDAFMAGYIAGKQDERTKKKKRILNT